MFKKKKKTIFTKLFKILIVAQSIIALMSFPIYISAIFVVLGFVLIISLIRFKNKRIEKNNRFVEMYNNKLQAQYDETVYNIDTLKKELYQRCGSWYPKSYYCLDAVDFFIKVIENYRADTVKEMVNLYEASEHRRRMEEGQKRILAEQEQLIAGQQDVVNQLVFANVLNWVNLKMR